MNDRPAMTRGRQREVNPMMSAAYGSRMIHFCIAEKATLLWRSSLKRTEFQGSNIRSMLLSNLKAVCAFHRSTINYPMPSCKISEHLAASENKEQGYLHKRDYYLSIVHQ